MQFVHERHHLQVGDIVVVTASEPCNVKLTDDANFERYQNGRSHNYYGGYFRQSPARILAPGQGHWNVTLDLGGASGTITHSIAVVRYEQPTPPPR